MNTSTNTHTNTKTKPNTTNQQVIGLFGLGNVGNALFQVIAEIPKSKAYIKRISVKNRHKKREVPEHLITFNASDILNDPEINLVVELTNDANEA